MKTSPVRAIFFLTVFLTAAPALVHADSFPERDHLLGDSGGFRPSLQDDGIEFELVYTGEFFSDTDGGANGSGNVGYLDNIDLTLSVDTAQTGLWNDGAFFVYLLSNSGDNPSDDAGDLQVTSNIEANDTARVYELWYEHSFDDGALAVLFGLHDLNSEFYTSDYAGLFLNSSFGIGPDISANVPVSIFNVTALAIRVKANLTDSVTALVAVYDGDPGNADSNDNGLNIKIDPDKEGFMNIGEVQFSIGQDDGFLPGVYRFGTWAHTADFPNVTNNKTESVNFGVYLTFDQLIFRPDDGDGLGVFGQAGFAPEDRNEVSYYFGVGINYTGLIANRGSDILGVAYNYARISDDFAKMEALENGGTKRTFESVLEMTYRAVIFPWLAVQPDYQIVENPGGDPDIDPAHVVTLRFEVNF